jgi:hypothetical protein
MSKPIQETAASGEHKADTARQQNGQFGKGNSGGPGNPFARQVAGLRKALISSITAEDIRAIAAKLVELARAGDLAAAKLILAYTIGKPQPAVEPDHLDVQEWEKLKATAHLFKELPRTMGPGLDLPLRMARAVRPGMESDVLKMMGESLGNQQRMEDVVASTRFPGEPGEDGGLPSTNGINRPKPPSTNGHHQTNGQGGKRRFENGKLVPA